MIRCGICEHSYCPGHHLKHGMCKIQVNVSIPFFSGLRTDPFPFVPNSMHLKLPLCCAPECESTATNQCSNINENSLDKCGMYFCDSHSVHDHHLCDYQGCDKYAVKCFDRPFGCDDIRCDYHYQLSE